jgi:Tfp pilus assembly protein PilF
MVYLIARRIFGKGAAIVSGFATALYTPFIFYDGLLLSESIQILLVTAALLLLVTPSRKYRWLTSLSVGLLIGMAALGRATIIFFAIALAAYWLTRARRGAKKERRQLLNSLALFSAGVVLGILPATIHNMSHGDFVLISSNTGINFYIGNNANANGIYEEPKGLDLFKDFSGRQIAEKKMGRPLKSSEVSSFWTSEALRDIGQNPLRFVRGLVKKTWLYLWYFDIAQAESIHIQNIFSSLFKLPLIGFGAVFLFGTAGFLSSGLDERRWILILLLVSNLAGVILFFVLGRFRLIGAVPLLISSGAGVTWLVMMLRDRNRRALAIAGIIGAAGLAILFLPRPIDKREKSATVLNNVGVYYYFTGDYAGAEKWYRQASEILPGNTESLNNIGTVFYARNNLDSSAFYFHRSLEADSLSDKTLMNLGRISLVRGQTDSARYYYLRAKAAAPFGTSADEAIAELDRQQTGVAGQPVAQSFDVLYERAQRYAAAGRFDLAEEGYLAALAVRPDDIAALNNLGFAYQAQKKYTDAARVFERVLHYSPENGVAYNNLAGTLYQMGKLDSAITLWEKAIRLDPDKAQFRKNLEYARGKRQPDSQ